MLDYGNLLFWCKSLTFITRSGNWASSILKNEIFLEISIDIAFGHYFASLLQECLFDHDSNKSQVMDEDTSKALRSNDIRNAHAHKPANQASNQTLELFKCCTQLSGDDPKHCWSWGFWTRVSEKQSWAAACKKI